MDDLEINLARGDRAKLLLEDELLNEMLKRVEDDCYREIRSSKLMEGPVREQAYLLLTTVDILRAKLDLSWIQARWQKLPLYVDGVDPQTNDC